MSESIAKVIEEKLVSLNDLASQVNELAVQLKKNEEELTVSVNSAVSLIQQLKSKKDPKDMSNEDFDEVKKLLGDLEGVLNKMSDSMKENPDTAEVKTTVKSLQDLLQPENKSKNDEEEDKDTGLIETIKSAFGMGEDEAEKVEEDVKEEGEEEKESIDTAVEEGKNELENVKEEGEEKLEETPTDDTTTMNVIKDATENEKVDSIDTDSPQSGGYRYSSKGSKRKSSRRRSLKKSSKKSRRSSKTLRNISKMPLRKTRRKKQKKVKSNNRKSTIRQY